jgi:hypothetical protein
MMEDKSDLQELKLYSERIMDMINIQLVTI